VIAVFREVFSALAALLDDDFMSFPEALGAPLYGVRIVLARAIDRTLIWAVIAIRSRNVSKTQRGQLVRAYACSRRVDPKPLMGYCLDLLLRLESDGDLYADGLMISLGCLICWSQKSLIGQFA